MYFKMKSENEEIKGEIFEENKINEPFKYNGLAMNEETGKIVECKCDACHAVLVKGDECYFAKRPGIMILEDGKKEGSIHLVMVHKDCAETVNKVAAELMQQANFYNKEKQASEGLIL